MTRKSNGISINQDLDSKSINTIRNYIKLKTNKNEKTLFLFETGFLKKRRRHTLPQICSTICAGGLNYSVRDGKR